MIVNVKKGLIMKRQFLVLLATILGSTVVILDGSIVNLALPKIAEEMHAGYSALQWVTDSYLLSLSALILLGGSLGDIYGRKKIYLIGLVGFGLSSLFCALVSNVELLIAARLLQGIFGALLVPGALSIITTNFEAGARAQAIGRWTAWTSIAVVIAPFLGGWILDVSSWRWIFLINLPLVVSCLVLGISSIKETKDSNPRNVDIMSAFLVSLSLAGITYGLIEGPSQHWSLLTVISLVVGLLTGYGFIAWQKRSRDPMIKMQLFTSRNFVGANLMTFMMYGALSGFLFAITIYLQVHMKYSALQAGISLLPISILLLLFSGIAGKLSSQYGPRLFMTMGPLFTAAGMIWLFFLKLGDSYITGIFPGALLFGVGMALLVAPLTTTVMASVHDADSGIASGINNAVSRVAGLIVIAVLGFFGANSAYHFAILLCVILALGSGIISYVIIEKVSDNS
jgi:EmrB/QacA subfamily drug resistance transporter